MEFGIGLMGEHPAQRMRALCHLIESSGFDQIWVSDERFYRDVFVNMTLAVCLTHRVKVGSMVTDPFVRHPALTAAAAASVDELSGGRCILGMGAGISGFQRVRPAIARTRPLIDDFTVEAYGRLAGEDVESQAELLGLIRPSSVAYACTSGSFIRGVEHDRDIGVRIRRASGAPATTTSTAMVNALRALGARRVAVATPYRDVINQRLTAFLATSGFSVENNMGLGLDDWTINFVPQSDVYHLARKADTAGADVLFIACTNLRALDVIEPLEADLAKPVVTANQATMWEALKLAGIRERPQGFGTLFALHETGERAVEDA